ncbi:Triple functional domain protein [Manis javanica]|nr:Triple functional domain protein [Manis javanica]
MGSSRPRTPGQTRARGRDTGHTVALPSVVPAGPGPPADPTAGPGRVPRSSPLKSKGCDHTPSPPLEGWRSCWGIGPDFRTRPPRSRQSHLPLESPASVLGPHSGFGAGSLGASLVALGRGGGPAATTAALG